MALNTITNIMIQDSFYHPGDLTHSNQLSTEILSGALLDASCEVDTSPISHSVSIDHFLNFMGKVIIDFILFRHISM